MEDDRIRTMKFLGFDGWARPVYKCIETGNVYKDIALGSKSRELYNSCDDDFDGEPDRPIKDDLIIKFI